MHQVSIVEIALRPLCGGKLTSLQLVGAITVGQEILGQQPQWAW